MPQLAAVHSLLSLLSEVDFGADAAASRPASDELAEYSVGLRLKQQLLARRAERLARFLRLQLPAGSPAGTPRGSSGGRSPARATPACGPGSRAASRGPPERCSSSEPRDPSPSSRGEAQWSPGEGSRGVVAPHRSVSPRLLLLAARPSSSFFSSTQPAPIKRHHLCHDLCLLQCQLWTAWRWHPIPAAHPAPHAPSARWAAPAAAPAAAPRPAQPSRQCPVLCQQMRGPAVGTAAR